ncbi:MAG TPA: ABC transporter ATP-binding protein [Gammaproteobacteria bacterium]|jgi:heme-transporting ATPase|nr:ABC transporter ATP-binding protein [Gammaproteobacteria bacterium]
MSLFLELLNITKSFPKTLICENISYTFQPGCYALLGPNGIGKTVFLEMLAGVACQDAGSIYLTGAGKSTSVAYKKKLVYVPSKPLFFPTATGKEFLDFILSIKNKKNCGINTENLDAVLTQFGLLPYLHKPFHVMSLGTQKKLFLSTLAIGKNDLIVLDEPSNALDEQACDFLCSLINRFAEHAIVIIATHDMQWVSRIRPTVLNAFDF